MSRTVPVVALWFALVLSIACSQAPAKEEPKTTPNADQAAGSPPAAPPAAKVEHVFRGEVLKVDVAAKSLTVNGENVEGWMGAMTMAYTPDNPDVLDKLKAGDTITAKVFDGDFSTLHDVQVAAAVKK